MNMKKYFIPPRFLVRFLKQNHDEIYEWINKWISMTKVLILNKNEIYQKIKVQYAYCTFVSGIASSE